MKKKRQGIMTAIVGALALVVVVVGPERASGQGDIHVLMPAGSLRVANVDVVDGPGLDLGDGVAARSPLVDAASGEDAGMAYFECTVMRRISGLDRGMWRCTYHLKLADGGIVVQGLDPRGPGASTFAVLGGTRAYRDASGDAVFTDSNEGTDIVITLT